MTTTLTIGERFCGPPDSGNGGYSAGSLARHVAGALRADPSATPHTGIEVTLRAPVPLARPLTVISDPNSGGARLVDGDETLATARAVTLDIDLPPPVGVAAARAIVMESPMLRAPDEHPFPGCFVCGPGRATGDGLRLFPARVPGRDVYAVAWSPAEVSIELVWAALDCPSSFPMYLQEEPFPGPVVLGRIAARIERLPGIGDDCVVMSWRESVDGRKLHTASTLLDGEGQPLAVARATWIRLAR